MAQTQPDLQAIAFGEIVFDRFEDSVCIGGAPLNFAWYLRQFGIRVAMVSAIGRDELGDIALRRLDEAGIETSGVSRRSEPTGTVDVRLVNGEAEFTINEGAAYDTIELRGNTADMRPALVYFGTVAQKTEVNRATLRRLWASGPRHRLYDVNLRQHHVSPEIVIAGLKEATLLKLSDEEWTVIRGMTSQHAPAELLEPFGLAFIALTRGSRGAILYGRGKEIHQQSPPANVVDTIGAGDAFAAALAAGVMGNAKPEHTLHVACTAGAAVVEHRGAQVELPDALRSAFER